MQIVCTCYLVLLSIAHLKAICVPFSAHSVSFIFQYSTAQKHFFELDILCVIVLCYAKITQFTAIETFVKHNGHPNKPKAFRLWPTYRLTSVYVNTPSKSSLTQSQTKIVGTLRPKAVFFVLMLLLSLSKLFIAVQSVLLCCVVLCQNNSVYCYRNVRETQWTPQQTKSVSLVTDLPVNLRICQHAFKVLPDTISDKNSWDT